jgi:molybdopterin-guanine dinucleotide biosynthesis protein A
VLAGGESRRFGRDKAGEIVGGQPLVTRAAETLSQVVARVVVVSSRAPATKAWPHLSDLREGLGPLAGLEAALAEAVRLGLDGVLVLACDLPLVEARTLRALADALAPGTLAVAPARAEDAEGGGSRVEPLCAAYRVACLPAVRSSLDEGRLAVHGLFAAVGGVRVPMAPEAFLNLNRPTDRRHAEEALRHRKA